MERNTMIAVLEYHVIELGMGWLRRELRSCGVARLVKRNRPGGTFLRRQARFGISNPPTLPQITVSNKVARYSTTTLLRYHK